MTRHAVTGALLAALLVACPDQASTSAAPGTQTQPVDRCQKEGQSCVYAPGKLGLCTARDPDCDAGPACLICVSLH